MVPYVQEQSCPVGCRTSSSVDNYRTPADSLPRLLLSHSMLEMDPSREPMVDAKQGLRKTKDDRTTYPSDAGGEGGLRGRCGCLTIWRWIVEDETRH